MPSNWTTDLEPGGQGLVDSLQREHLASAYFGFELCLRSLKEAFDESAGRRIAHAAVAALATPYRFQSSLTILLAFPPERGARGLAPLAIGNEMLAVRQFGQKATRLFRSNVPAE